MVKQHSYRCWHGREWTLALCLTTLFLNWGLLPGSPHWARQIVAATQFDRSAILHGELWRLMTGNLVHWSAEHFVLDLAVFLIVGWIYEPILKRAYSWLILSAGLAVGAAILLLRPDLTIYRGLSGVDSGVFAAALAFECAAARRERQRWYWVAPATAIFLTKICFECTTGRLFFGTESLGDVGQPVPLAHVAGVAATAIMLLTEAVKSSSNRKVVAGTANYACPWSHAGERPA